MIKKKIAVIVGTRPNFVKCTCLLKELEQNKKYFDYALINTGQHYDYKMAGSFFNELEIPEPDISLNAVSGHSHVQTIAKIIRNLGEVFSRYRFDFIIVFGDVNSTLAAAIASVKNNQKLVHIEAGLRSNDRRMPEEINRVITDHISDIHFTSEESGNINLRSEGIEEKSIHFVGNIMIDTLMYYSNMIDNKDTYKKYMLKNKNYIVSTIHRQENVDDPYNLKLIFESLNEIAEKKDIIIPAHPRTVKMLEENKLTNLRKRIKMIDPIGYFDFINLVKNSSGVITDSGGIQEETSFLKIPCVTLRDNTERPITIHNGTNTLIDIHGTNFVDNIMSGLFDTNSDKHDIKFWDGNTSKRIIKTLNTY